MLNDRNTAAIDLKNAERMLLSESCPGCLFKYLDPDFADIFFDPFIEYCRKKDPNSLAGTEP